MAPTTAAAVQMAAAPFYNMAGQQGPYELPTGADGAEAAKGKQATVYQIAGQEGPYELPLAEGTMEATIENLKVGQNVLVLRSDGSKSKASITDVHGSSRVTVTLKNGYWKHVPRDKVKQTIWLDNDEVKIIEPVNKDENHQQPNDDEPELNEKIVSTQNPPLSVSKLVCTYLSRRRQWDEPPLPKSKGYVPLSQSGAPKEELRLCRLTAECKMASSSFNGKPMPVRSSGTTVKYLPEMEEESFAPLPSWQPVCALGEHCIALDTPLGEPVTWIWCKDYPPNSCIFP